MALHIIAGEEEFFEEVLEAARKKNSCSWIIPKNSTIGDEVLLYFKHLDAFVGCGEVSSTPEPKMFRKKHSYRGDVGKIKKFKKQVKLEQVAKLFPQWEWPNSKTRSLTSKVPPNLLDTIMRLADAGTNTKRFPFPTNQEVIRLAEEVPSGSVYSEGSVQRILINRYERDPLAREECLRHYGTTCFLCGFDFVAVYGEVMTGFTHVHHLNPLSSVGADYEIDPIQDLRPVCPNCHAVLHRQEPPYSLDEVREFLRACGGSAEQRAADRPLD